MTLREAKQAIRALIGTWSDQRVHDVFAFNTDGRMNYWDPCGCLRGVSLAHILHSRNHGIGVFCSGSHYRRAHSRVDKLAELAYGNIGFPVPDIIENGESCELRQRRLSPILRAEIRRRERLARQVEQAVEVVAV